MRVSIYARILLAALPKSTNTPTEANLDVFTRIESYQAYKKLELVLTDMQFCQQEVSQASLQPLLDCFNQRWNEIKRSRSSYEISNSLANTAYISIAADLCKECGGNKYKLLIPSLLIDKDSITGAISDFRPHEFALSDDVVLDINKPPVILPIIVYQSLIEAKKNDGKLMLTRAPGHEKVRELNDAEKNRIINHSGITKKYYAGEAKDSELFDGLLFAEKYYVVTAYGAEGDHRQKVNAIKNITDSNDLIHILKNILKSNEWLPFLAEISTADLKRIFADSKLNMNKLILMIQDPAAYIHNDDNHNRCVLIVFYELYKRIRNEEWSLTPFGVDKKTKLDSVSQMQQFLASDKPLTSFSDELDDPALSQGRLIGFKLQIQKLIDPNFKPEPSMLQKVFGY